MKTAAFANNCGASIETTNVSINYERKLDNIFQSVYRTLRTNSEYSEKEFEEKKIYVHLWYNM